MNILIASGSGHFTNALIDKLNKNGHTVYLLTGDESGDKKYSHVFERYDFPYSSDSVFEILKGIHPDIVLFLGAYDPHYTWQDSRKESVRFTTDLSNILSSYSTLGSGRFIYLSSQCVFPDDTFAECIAEDEKTSAKDFRSLAIMHGEEICKGYQNKAQCVIVRIDHMYGYPFSGAQEDPCLNTAIKLLHGAEQDDFNNGYDFSMLHQNDAVEFLYRIIEKKNLKYDIYNLSSEKPITEYRITQHIAGTPDAPVVRHSFMVEEIRRNVLSSKRFRQEFHAEPRISYQKGIQEEWAYIRKRRNELFPEQIVKRKGSRKYDGLSALEMFRILFPYIEALFFIVPVFFLSLAASGNVIFDRLDPYLLYELVIAMVHGQHAAVFSAFLAAAGFLVQSRIAAGGVSGSLLNYSTYLWIAQLLITGMSAGYLRDQIREIRSEKKHEAGELQAKLSEMETINDSNARMKQLYEKQIVNQRDSLGKIYEVTSALEKRSPEEVLFYAAKVLSELMGTKDAAVYVVANDDYARLFSFTSQKAKALGSSVCYTQTGQLGADLADRQVFVNHEMDERYPQMACGIYTNDKMRLILMLWGLPLEKMNLSEANRLRVISYLIQNASLRANEYFDVLKSQRYLPGSRVLNETAFHELAVSFLNARDQRLTECALLHVCGAGPEDMDDVQKLGGSLRQSDYIGLLHGSLYLLLCNTDPAGAEAVISRLKQKGIMAENGDWSSISLPETAPVEEYA